MRNNDIGLNYCAKMESHCLYAIHRFNRDTIHIQSVMNHCMRLKAASGSWLRPLRYWPSKNA